MPFFMIFDPFAAPDDGRHVARKKIRVIQYGVGPIGASLVRLMREKSAIELIGAIDIDPGKAGRDLGEVIGAGDAPWGIPVIADADVLLRKSADVVVHSTVSSLPAAAEELLACLAAESCVVSTCEELAYPRRKYPEIAAKLDAEAKAWGVAIVGTGVNPGFVMDKLVLTLGATARRIEAARVVRVVNASLRRDPLQRKIGAGLSVEEFREKVAAGTIKHHGLPESVAMVSDGLGLEVEGITETIEPVIAQDPVRTAFLEVAPGQASGVRQIARGLANGQERIYMELQMYVGAPESSDIVELHGDPDIRLVIPGGTHGDIATAGVVVNSIPALLDAPAGLRSARDLPICFFPPLANP
jgi:hypothetical protein